MVNYKKKLNNESKEFEKYLETINRQIKDIEKLVNEFSNFGIVYIRLVHDCKTSAYCNGD